MFKVIYSIFFLIIFLMLILLFLLFNGINIYSISYKDINIDKIYLKYDKKLILNFNKIEVNKNIYINSANITITDFDKTSIKLNKFFMAKPYLKADTTINFNISTISKEKLDFSLENLRLQYDKNLKIITSPYIKGKYEDDTITLIPNNLYYDKVPFYKSQIKITNISKTQTLILDLYSHTLINNDLLNYLKYYNIDLPIKQYDGYNDINAYVQIPFSDKPLDIKTNISIKKAKLSAQGITTYIKDAKIVYENNKVDIKLSIQNTKDDKYNYNLDINNSINLKTNIVDAIAHINSIKYDKISIKNTDAKIDLNIKNTPSGNIKFLKPLLINYDKEKVILNKLKFFISNNTVTTKTKGKYTNINFTLNDTFDTKQHLSKGSTNIYIKDKNITLKNIKYNLDYNDLKVDISIFDQLLQYNNLSVNLNNLDLVYTKDNTINLSSDISLDKKTKFVLNDTKIDLNRKVIDGFIDIKYSDDIVHLSDKKVKFFFNYQDNFILKLPRYNLLYSYNKINHSIRLNKTYLLCHTLKAIKCNSFDGKIDIETKDFTNLNISMDNFALILNEKFIKNYKTKKDENKSTPIKIDIKAKNGAIQYKEYKLPYDKLTLKIDDNVINGIIKDNNTTIRIHKDKNILNIKSDHIQSKFINKLAKKNVLEGGYINLNLQGYKNIYKGKIILKNTIVKDLKIVNTLITFINTSPAIINPLLAIPTLATVIDKDFSFTTYTINDGYIDFVYDNNRSILNIPDLYTKSKLSDFKGTVYMNFKQNNIDGELEVSFLKTYAKLIKAIPIVGNLTLGKDGGFHTKITLYGKLDDPQFETHTIKSFVQGVGDSIKNIFTLDNNN